MSACIPKRSDLHEDASFTRALEPCRDAVGRESKVEAVALSISVVDDLGYRNAVSGRYASDP